MGGGGGREREGMGVLQDSTKDREQKVGGWGWGGGGRGDLGRLNLCGGGLGGGLERITKKDSAKGWEQNVVLLQSVCDNVLAGFVALLGALTRALCCHYECCFHWAAQRHCCQGD